MALLLETTLGDLVIDLDVDGSPEICRNVLKLAKARYYTSTLVYNVQANRFCQLGDPQGDGSGGACIYGLISTLLASDDGTLSTQKVLQSQQRFLRSNMGRPLTREECQEKGRVVATEMKGIADTIGSQLLITTSEGQDMALDGFNSNAGVSTDGENRQLFRSVGVVREDDNQVLDQIALAYCDAEGRPYADIRIIRALVVDDPFDDPPGMQALLKLNGIEFDDEDRVIASPEYERPPDEKVEIRIHADQVDPLTWEQDIEKMREQEEEIQKREDKSRAVVLEMLGDLPDAEIKAPENVLFVCKLNPVTEDDDLELIFSRFDEKVKAEIIRDHDTGSSLQYAFVEFTTKERAVEAYFKMNNALVDDRRIKVDFSQSVAKVWNKFTQRSRNPGGRQSNQNMPKDPFSGASGTGHNRNGRRPGQTHNNRGLYTRRQQNLQGRDKRPRQDNRHGHTFTNDDDNNHNPQRLDDNPRGSQQEEPLDSFGRRLPPRRDQQDREANRKGDRNSGHELKEERRYDDRRRREYDSDSDGEAEFRRHRRGRSESSGERKHRKRSHKRHASHRKRSREDDSGGDEGKSRGSKRHHENRDRYHESRGGRDRSERNWSADRSVNSDEKERSHGRRRHEDRRKHHRSDRDHRRRSEDRKKSRHR